jgi:hypothetical protein
MAGKRGRSGPPGNMNASRHAIDTWLRRRALPLRKQHVATMVKQYEESLVTCKGGLGAVTEVEQALIRNAGHAFGAVLLVLEEAAARGFVVERDGTWDLSPGFARIVGILSTERQALVALGLTRRAKDVPSLSDYLATRTQTESEATP